MTRVVRGFSSQTTLSPCLWTIDLYGKTNSWQTEKLVAPEVRHRHSEIHSRVHKFAQDLHVGSVAVEAEKKSLKPRSKHARFLAFRRPTGKALYGVQRLFVLQ